MVNHSLDNNTHTGHVISLCLNENPLISLIPRMASNFRHLLSYYLQTFTVKAIRNILHEFVRTFSKFIKNYEFHVQSSHANSRTNSCMNSYTNSRKQKKKFVPEFQKFVHEF